MAQEAEGLHGAEEDIELGLLARNAPVDDADRIDVDEGNRVSIDELWAALNEDHVNMARFRDIVANLSINQINVPREDFLKRTALHQVALLLPKDPEKFLECLDLLLDKGIDAAAQDGLGNTALHYAAQSGVEESVLQLLRSGCGLDIKNCIDEPAVERILPSTLETFFDSRIQCRKEQSSSEFGITFDYSPFVATNKCIESSRFPNIKGGYESDVLGYIGRSSSHRYLIKHPLVTSFLELKWRSIRPWYYSNLGAFFVTLLVLSAYTWLQNFDIGDDYSRLKDVFRWVPIVYFFILFSILELTNLLVNPLRYFSNIRNLIKIGFLICLGFVLFASDPHLHLGAVAVLLAWVQFMLILGNHPKLATMITMLITVSMNSLYLLVFYSTLLIGFVLSFSLVFHSKDQEKQMFSNLESSMLKVASMLTGELTYDDLPFSANYWTSRLIFAAFLFFATIILFNLLVSKAVSDIQEIQSKAEIVAYVKRVEMILHLKRTLEPPSCWPNCVPLLLQINLFRKLLSLFHECLPRKTYTIFPNQKLAYTTNDHPERTPLRMCQCHKAMKLPNGIVQDALRAYQRSQKQSADPVFKKLENIDSTLSHILQTLRIETLVH